MDWGQTIMARKFKGKNDITSAKDIWYHRADFYVNAHQDTKTTKDTLFFEQAYYGMIDTDDRSIVPLPQFMKPLSSRADQGAPIVALDFVADAFNDVRRSFQYACNAGLLSKENPFMYAMEAVRAYRSPYDDYENSLSGIFLRYNEDILANYTDVNNIITFDDYVKFFLQIISQDETRTPITMEKWCRSTEASIFNSGLAIDIAGLDIGDDQVKIDNFIDDNSYGYYKKVMLERGFSIMENAPFIIIADLKSPAMAPYISKYRINNIEQLFNNRYNKSYNINLNIIKRIIVKYYNFFVILNNRAKEIITCNGITRQKYTNRSQITLDLINEDVWTDLYVSFRNYEEGFPLSDQKIKSIKKRAKILDSDTVMGYINNEFGNQTWNKPYGYDDFVRETRKPISSVPFSYEPRTSANATPTSNISRSPRISQPSSGGGTGGGGSSY